MILLIDNYDSFVHNLARYFRRLGYETSVVRNDATRPSQVLEQRPEAVVLSPGPCAPLQAGCSVSLVREIGQRIPILGVCLGHQAIATAFGGQVVRAREPIHGRTSEVFHDGQGIFAGVPSPLTACRYHSLVVDPASLPDSLQVTATTADGVIMALQHERWPIAGMQFHPESVLTDDGFRLLCNFLHLAGLPLPPSLPSIADEVRPAASLPSRVPTEPVTF